MSTLAVAKKDYHDAIRSRELWALIAVFVLFLGGAALIDLWADTSIDDGLPVVVLLTSIFVMVFLVPCAALLVSIKSIVRERSLGTIIFLLALPHSRFEVYVGKLLGRLAVFTTAVLVGYLPALLLLAAGVDGFDPVPFVGVLVVMLLFGFIYVVLGHNVSAMTTSETRASVAGFAVFVLMYTWDTLFYVLNSQFELLDGHAETFVLRFQLQTVAEDIVKAVESLRDSDVGSASVAVSGGGDVPFYLYHWFAVVVLGIWLGLPLALGYWRFSRADL
ncbi:ABC transporter permease [Haloterrigena sp. SYSU A121-1]|uniref:ABC transporter permease n=1 Tax=Haloterrigena gelatinilytica TaxID=2741724 RepID=A0A8J8KAB0_9EURY|nr:ABC transporter permease subunit [Haloterrigena gelatinilytica]NUB90040.1 ABC transporter permease [Haloterrigena gelatinilytica]